MGCAGSAALALVRRDAWARHAAVRIVRNMGGHRAGNLRGGVRLRGGSRNSGFCQARADDAAGMVADRGRLWRRFPVRRGGAVHQRGLVPVDARPSRRRRRRDGNLAPRGGAESGPDGGLGIDRRGIAGARIAAALPRPRRRYSAARPCHLASLSQGHRTGSQSAPDPSPPPTGPALGGGFSTGIVSMAAPDRRVERESQSIANRDCEPTGRANAGPMTGSAEQSKATTEVWIAFVAEVIIWAAQMADALCPAMEAVA